MPAPEGRTWKVEHLRRGVARITARVGFTDDDHFWILLRSDAHHDSPKQDREMEMRHLAEARKKDAPIIDNGDLFDSMGGKWDRRNIGSADLRPELQGASYLTDLPEYVADSYQPYSDLFAVWGVGNHETAMLKHHQVDLTQALCTSLNARTGTKHQVHGYSGWVQVRIYRPNKESNFAKTFNIFRHHGSGHGAPVTRGTIGHNRRQTWLPDADVIVTGHDHNEWVLPRARHRISQAGVPFVDEVHHVKIPGYKGTGSLITDGYEAEKEFDPKTSAAYWLRVFYHRPDRRYRFDIQRAT